MTTEVPFFYEQGHGTIRDRTGEGVRYTLPTSSLLARGYVTIRVMATCRIIVYYNL